MSKLMWVIMSLRYSYNLNIEEVDKMRTIKIILTFCAIVVFLIPSVLAQEKNEIILGCETSLLPSLVWVAENKGYFQEEGITVKIKEFGSGRTALRTMLEESNLDMVTVAQTPIMFNSFKRDDFVVISAMVSSNDDVKVLVRKDRGIACPADLKGKTIGITRGSTGQYFLGLVLSYHLLKLSDVQTVDLEASKLAQALVDGQVDAISTWEPHIYNAQRQLGDKALLLPTANIFREDFYFVPKRDFLKNNPKTLRKFLKALNKAEKFIRKNKEEAMDIVAGRLKIDRQLVSSIWEDFDFGLFLDQSVLVVLEDEARWAMKEGLVEKKEAPNYLNFIDDDALDEAKPGASTIIHER
jgi:NitT/TauT family transport system substrate-binding protein